MNLCPPVAILHRQKSTYTCVRITGATSLYRSYAFVEIARRAEVQRQTIIDITHRRVAAGLDTKLEMRQAEGQLPQARVARTQAQASAELALHQLAAIRGAGAELYAMLKPPTLNPDAALPIPVVLPINLLARRPDVLAARAGIDAADAKRQAAKAAFYPDINLRAVAGFGAFGLSELFRGDARGFGGGPFISLPVFDAGRLRAEYRGSEAELGLAVATYNTTVLQAVQQTADRLTQVAALAQERVDQQETLAAAEDAYRLATVRYRSGLASYLVVLNAETQVLEARRAMADIKANQVLARVTLLLAVGGTFDPSSSVHTTRLTP